MLRYSVDPAFIGEVADGAGAALEGTARPVRGIDILGQDVTEFWFDRFSIMTPWTPAWPRNAADCGGPERCRQEMLALGRPHVRLASHRRGRTAAHPE